ncbi:hypothetical protein Y032_0273g990 [Ancylostoma ceylanicum]|uniref:Uncharacterized protein n=1 Tax=Ancylostoma ceylanicum TaxID=53326 RepID=A0A016S821_9BILA|nr:hypothetical protein Y032_0273g990 [Ancylostoma ceylanicum]
MHIEAKIILRIHGAKKFTINSIYMQVRYVTVTHFSVFINDGSLLQVKPSKMNLNEQRWHGSRTLALTLKKKHVSITGVFSNGEFIMNQMEAHVSHIDIP